MHVNWRRAAEIAYDKLFLGVVLALILVAVNHLVVEPERSKRALEDSVAEKRVQKIAFLWEQLDAEQERLRDIAARTRELVEASSQIPRGTPIREVMRTLEPRRNALEREIVVAQTKLRTLERLVAESRIWITDELYPRYVAYLRSEERVLAALLSIPGFSEECGGTGAVSPAGAAGTPSSTCTVRIVRPRVRWSNLDRVFTGLDKSREELIKAVGAL